ncbi:MAG: hypothetical protein ACYDD1_23115 [Caulobacteraceae bacterium]
MPRDFRLAAACHKTIVMVAAGFALGLASCGHAAPANAPVGRAQDFVDRLGVNVHVEYTDSRYASAPDVIASLKYLGLNLVRDNALSPYNRGQQSYSALANAGIRFDMITDGQPPEKIIAALSHFEMERAGSVHAIEGINEINNWKGFSYKGVSDKHAAAVLYQTDIYDAVKASAVLKSKPVYNLTDYPDQTGKADYAAFHSYPNGWSDCEHGNLAKNLASQQAVMPGIPVVNTEIGASTQPQKGSFDEKSQARFLLMCVFDNSLLGVKETYLYELYDGHDDPSGANTQAHFGLFGVEPGAGASGRRPKVAASAIHNLASWLTDPTPGAAQLPVRSFAWAQSAVPSGVRSLILTKANGDASVVFWSAAPVWNGGPVELPPAVVRLAAPARYATVEVVDLITGHVLKAAPSAIDFSIGSDPILVSLKAR